MASLSPENDATHQPVFWPELERPQSDNPVPTLWPELADEDAIEAREVFDAAAHEKALRSTKFEVKAGHKDGTFLLFEGLDPDLNRREEDHLTDVASEIASLDARVKRLTAEEDDRKDEAVKIAEGSEGQRLRGVRLIAEDVEVQIIPTRSPRVRDPNHLKERAGENFPNIANEVTTASVTLPGGVSLDLARVRAALEREARRAGTPRDKAPDAVKVDTKTVYDFDKIEALQNAGEIRLNEGAIDDEPNWKVTPGRLERTSKTGGKKKDKN